MRELMKEGTKQLPKSSPSQTPLPESYLLCRDCDGTWVDAKHGACAHCTHHTTSRDFHLCLSCALNQKRCQHCGSEVEIRITNC